jgi:hypothetical protein
MNRLTTYTIFRIGSFWLCILANCYSEREPIAAYDRAISLYNEGRDREHILSKGIKLIAFDEVIRRSDISKEAEADHVGRAFQRMPFPHLIARGNRADL